jgi:hypothetical protein
MPMLGTHSGLAIWRVSYFYEIFVQGSTAVILLNFCAKNPPHRQAAKRQAVKKLSRNEKLFGYLLEKNFIQQILRCPF